MSNLSFVSKWNTEINQLENGEPATGGVNGNINIAPTQLAENIWWLKDEVEKRVTLSEKDAINGIATLGPDKKILTSQLPLLGSAASKNVGKAAAEIPLNSDLGSASTRNVGKASGNLMETGAYGLGGETEAHNIATSDPLLAKLRTEGSRFFRNEADTDFTFASSPSLYINSIDTYATISVSYNGQGIKVAGGVGTGYTTYNVYTDKNTSIDNNGFVRRSGNKHVVTTDTIGTGASQIPLNSNVVTQIENRTTPLNTIVSLQTDNLNSLNTKVGQHGTVLSTLINFTYIGPTAPNTTGLITNAVWLDTSTEI